MASGVTNRGKTVILDSIDSAAITFTARLATTATTPTVDTNTFSQLTETSNGNGYTTGGQAVTLAAASEDDTNDWATIAVSSFGWTASGGTIAYQYVCIVDNSGNLLFWFDNGSQTIASGTSHTFTNLTLKAA